MKRWWGRLEKRRVATESGRDKTGDPCGPGDETGDKTAATAVMNETAATGGVMYVDEGPYTIDVRHVEEMVGTTRKAADGERVRRGRDGDETGTRLKVPAVPGMRPAATAGDERDGGDRWGNVFGRRGFRI